ncbi:hypothetical protein VPNG_06961 [Cytospora leucostoma]|uniref:Uncharacterized protein n=1 Tax=Cytospora leucostoma TaxID=1230097 RepID=A0A423WXF1_9PEZI|nr:hypothetical protein VPNG_06961 [Cytospora leucostoma]
MASNCKHLRPFFVLLPCFIVLTYLLSLVAAECYWPDGSNAYDMHECYGTTGADGLCCAQGDLCLLNTLCQKNGTTHTYYRGACNTQNWTQAATCPEFCNDAKSGSNLTAAQPVGQCEATDNVFFCDTSHKHFMDCYATTVSAEVFGLLGKVLRYTGIENVWY